MFSLFTLYYVYYVDAKESSWTSVFIKVSAKISFKSFLYSLKTCKEEQLNRQKTHIIKTMAKVRLQMYKNVSVVLFALFCFTAPSVWDSLQELGSINVFLNTTDKNLNFKMLRVKL